MICKVLFKFVVIAKHHGRMYIVYFLNLYFYIFYIFKFLSHIYVHMTLKGVCMSIALEKNVYLLYFVLFLVLRALQVYIQYFWFIPHRRSLFSYGFFVLFCF